MMSPHDRFELRIFFRTNPIRTADDTRRLLETLGREAPELAPSSFHERHDRTEPFTLELIARQFAKRKRPSELQLSGAREVGLELLGYDAERDPGGRLLLRAPFALVADRGEMIVRLVTSLGRLVAPLYGWGHAKEDLSRLRDPNVSSAWAPKQVYQAYWLTILGAPIVAQLGAAHVAATPAHLVRVLEDGTALIVTSPDPGDVISRAARAGQARALVHLRPELDEASVLRELLERSARAAPVAARPPPAPPPVREWRPLAEAQPSDVAEAATALRAYDRAAEDYIAGFHMEIERLIADEPDALPRIDRFFLDRDYWRTHDVTTLERSFVLPLGALLARLLVRELGGRWVPRRAAEETQVIIGDRAWLPFLRVKRFVQSRSACLDHSLTAFFAAARDHA